MSRARVAVPVVSALLLAGSAGALFAAATTPPITRPGCTDPYTHQRVLPGDEVRNDGVNWVCTLDSGVLTLTVYPGGGDR